MYWRLEKIHRKEKQMADEELIEELIERSENKK